MFSVKPAFYRHTLFFITSALLVACGGGGDASHSLGDQGPSGFPTPTLVDCNDVFTEEKVAAFNQSQKAFYLKTSGYDVHCSTESRVNDNPVARTDVVGKSHLVILPQFRVVSFEKGAQEESYILKTVFTQASEADLKSILAALNINAKDRNPSDYIDAELSTPSYLRFSRGDLFSMGFTRLNGAGNENLINFILRTDDAGSSAALKLKMSEYLSQRNTLEFLWSPHANSLPKSEIGASQPIFSGVSAVSVLTSLVKDSVKSNQAQVYRDAIQMAASWGVTGSELNASLPELYAFAQSEWKSPAIADNTAFQLLLDLRYLLQVDPNSNLKNTLAAYEKISSFAGTTANGLKIAYDYASGKSYSAAQFNFLAEISGVLYPQFNNHSWELAQSIANHSQFERESGLFTAKVAMLMRASSMLDYSTPDLNAVFTKIASGLTPSNVDLYFSTLQYFKNSLRADSTDAEKACDSLVLSQQLTAQNQSVYFDFFSWLKNTAYADFSRALEVIKGASGGGNLQAEKVNGFKSVFEWLVNRAYLSRDTALTKAAQLAATPSFSDSSFLALQSYFDWLVNTAYLNRSDALTKAEDAFVVKHASAAQLQSIQDLMIWYTNTVYFNRSDALARAENLVWVKNISPDQAILLKDMVSFLINSVYLTRSDAATKAELYINLGANFNSARSESLKNLFVWYKDTMYQTRTDALASSEKIVISSQFDQGLVNVMEDAANWLRNTVSLSRSEAATKAEEYYQQNRLTAAQLSDLQAEYTAQRSHGQSSADALKYAEAKVLRSHRAGT